MHKASGLPFRQIHLDFHTSGRIPGVGSRFSRRQFQDSLRRGHVNSVNIFAKCHHGFSYHPTKVGRMHPHLKFDLLGEMIAACHEIGVKCPVYLSAGFDELYGERNPGHRAVPREGDDPLRVGWRRICFNTPYLDYLCEQIEEVVTTYPVDGVWLDIIRVAPCYCEHCQTEMEALGLDPRNLNQVHTHVRLVQKRYLDRTTEIVRRHRPQALLAHNAGHVAKGDRAFLDYNSHIELESLPTGGWGYDHFPLSVKYAATIPGHEYLGMTGKFHTHWGEFGGFKHPNALRYECALMAAYGARCCVGDQLHPSGEMNADTYELVGRAYAEIERKEPWLAGATPVADIAVLSMEALAQQTTRPDQDKLERSSQPDVGACRMFLESHLAFDVIDTEADFSRYRALVIPDQGRLGAPLADKLRAYLAAGGKLLLSHDSGLRADADEFCFPLGETTGLSPHDTEYLVAAPALAEDAARAGLWFPAGPFRIVGGSRQVLPAPGFERLAATHKPYFNRTRRAFCSHQNTPDEGPTGHPAVLLGENIAYFAHPVFTDYADYGQRLVRDLVRLVLERLLGGRLAIRAALPSAARVSLMRQSAARRHVFHVVHAAPVKRGAASGPHAIEVIEDVIPLHEVPVTLALAEPLASVTLQPQGEPLAFTQSEGLVSFLLPRVDLHQMVVLQHS